LKTQHDTHVKYFITNSYWKLKISPEKQCMAIIKSISKKGTELQQQIRNQSPKFCILIQIHGKQVKIHYEKNNHNLEKDVHVQLIFSFLIRLLEFGKGCPCSINIFILNLITENH
jgi:copper oxidase (laccase) domain-containing protein